MVVGSHLLGASQRVALFGGGFLLRDALRCQNVVCSSIVASSQLQHFRGEAVKTFAVAESTSADTPTSRSPPERDVKRQPRNRKAGPAYGRSRGKHNSQSRPGRGSAERRPRPEAEGLDSSSPFRAQRSTVSREPYHCCGGPASNCLK